MSTEIDEALDSMTPQELVTFEAELDKKAAEVKEAHLFAYGRKMARESVELYQKTGELTPALKVAHDAATPDPVAQLDAALDKMSAEELADFERAIDAGELTKSAEQKLAEEYAAEYFEIGREMAREHVAAMKKDAAPRIPKVKPVVAPPPAPGLGSKLKDIATQHPGATAGAALGLGYLLGDRK